MQRRGELNGARQDHARLRQHGETSDCRTERAIIYGPSSVSATAIIESFDNSI